MLTVLSNLIQYYIYLGKQNTSGSTWERYGPAMFVSVAFLLLMVHPTAFILKDLHLLAPVCQSDWGSRALRLCTHVGLAALLCGSLRA
mmetsp:Transcript_46497/g.108356  ORF Transcript_46497/g.108356 Transcript_46497/m.108356 type:complete len:88 (-) Transcript_46497:228-491(-)